MKDMENDNRENKTECQLQVLYDACEELSLLDRLRNVSLRLMSALRRRWLKRGITLGSRSEQRPSLGVTEKAQDTSDASSSLKGNGKDSMKKGDLVEILPLEEIKKPWTKMVVAKVLVLCCQWNSTAAGERAY